jgi:hypothetical protein
MLRGGVDGWVVTVTMKAIICVDYHWDHPRLMSIVYRRYMSADIVSPASYALHPLGHSSLGIDLCANFPAQLLQMFFFWLFESFSAGTRTRAAQFAVLQTFSSSRRAFSPAFVQLDLRLIFIEQLVLGVGGVDAERVSRLNAQRKNDKRCLRGG